jgi:hypothetical protein
MMVSDVAREARFFIVLNVRSLPSPGVGLGLGDVLNDKVDDEVAVVLMGFKVPAKLLTVSGIEGADCNSSALVAPMVLGATTDVETVWVFDGGAAWSTKRWLADK